VSFAKKIVVTLRTSRVHGRVPVHGTYTAIYTRPCTHAYAVYAPYTGPCTRPVHSRIHGPCTRPVHGSVNVRVHGPCTWPRTRPVVYMAGRPTGPCTHSQTARYGRVRPVTAVYTARYGRVHVPITARSRECIRPCTTADGRLTRAYVYTAVKRPCTRHVYVRVHG